MENRIYDENNGLWYARQGEYYLPEFALPPEEEKPIGIWGQRHLRYLKEHKQLGYLNLLTSGRLNEYLVSIDEQAEDMFSRLVKEYANRQGVTEQLKAENQFLWVQKMNNIRMCVREIVESVNCSILLAVYSVYYVREMERKRTAYTYGCKKCV